MTEPELEDKVKQELSQADLFQEVDWNRCLFIDFPTYVSLVLKDASRLDEAKRALAKVREELLCKSVSLEFSIRGEWEIESVSYAGVSRGKSGGIMNGSSYTAVLRCGRRRTEVAIEVSRDVVDTVRATSKMPVSEPEKTAFMEQTVRSLVQEWLSQSGEGSWDPIAEPRRIVQSVPLRVALSQA